MKGDHICKGGPRHGIRFSLLWDKVEIRAGDGLPGSYRKTTRTDDQGRVIWTYQEETTNKPARYVTR